jgi:predicted  nucleic acid-binding Zn-ribbon protein
MLPELEHLIRLQATETRAADARKRIADAPSRIAALDAKLTAARDAVAAAKQAVADNQVHRRTIDKDLLSAQQRLSKSKETLMAVKTNQEYHAMQSQIAAGTAEVERVEEQMLVNMVEADEVAARLKQAESTVKTEEAKIARERAGIEDEARQMEEVLSTSQTEREALVSQLPRALYEDFERVSKARQGIAVAEAADGHCTVCHVRLRPQVFNTIRRNDSIVHCDSCQRILYFTGVHERSAAGQAAVDAPGQQHADPNPPRP